VNYSENQGVQLSEEESESILSSEDRKVLKDLKLQTEPYAQIAEQNLELLAMLAESEVNRETVEDASKQLLEIIGEKDQILAEQKRTIQEQESKLNVVNKQLEAEKSRVNVAKNLIRQEIEKRKKLINEVVPTEKEIDRELES
jgi:hypothetical protein